MFSTQPTILDRQLIFCLQIFFVVFRISLLYPITSLTDFYWTTTRSGNKHPTLNWTKDGGRVKFKEKGSKIMFH